MSTDRERVLKVEGKPASLGPDLDIGEFTREAKAWSACPVPLLPKDIVRQSLSAGIRADEKDRVGTYFQIDHSVVFQGIQKVFEGKIDMMSTKYAFNKYGWFKDYWWKLVQADTDKYTALAERNWDHGYFIRVLEGQKVTLPLQSCLFISKDGLNQNVHNIIILEPEAEAQVITGCVVHPNVQKGLHVGVSEFYLKKGAKLTFTMIHNWAQNFDVRPRTAVFIEDGAKFVNNYICLKPVKSLQMYPVAYCKGVDSKVRFNSILYGGGNSYIDVGAKIVLQGAGSRGEVISNAIASDRAQIYARGLLVGEHSESKAHLECRGLLLSDKALIHAVPELTAKVGGTELSHEAAVGKIGEDQVQYLMARGFSEADARSLIVRGFMDVSIFGLPDELKDGIKRIVDEAVKGTL
ncbi:MAG: SufD family Fe-S cluster assembly protein [Candidatus Methylarchaceae archaeon HK01B]|nr:SufD family Fe-S cluster assembly protein [Candidatus Methylarchaceae archaeon HK01M]MCP8312380.1 SufD family Fe-S cluster assembly protein [Candidatus Methylarchaceae archaeon HK02M1]MCP8318564.1 SufD family Fe-S cluster assembly protein [Candidatus Methylarchaceae archaeon HK01B]